MKKIAYLFAFTTVFFFSCEENSTNENDETVIVTSTDTGETTDDNETSTETDEENDGILPIKIEVVEYIDDEISDEYTITYTYDGLKLISEYHSWGYYLTFEYENDLLIKINDVYYRIYETYDYNSEGEITTGTTYINNNNLTHIYDYTYSNDDNFIRTTFRDDESDANEITLLNGNILKNKEIGGDNYSMYEYTYDTKNAPFKNIISRDEFVRIDSENNYPHLYTKNNITSFTDSSSNGDDNPSSWIADFTITYTDDDYPRTITEDHNDGFKYVSTYTYNND